MGKEMKKTYNKLWVVLTLCYSTAIIAEENDPVVIQYDNSSYAVEGVFDTDDSIFEIQDIPSSNNQPAPVVLDFEQSENFSTIDTPSSNSNGSPTNTLEPMRPAQPVIFNPAATTGLTGLSSEIANVLMYETVEWQGLNNRLKNADEVRSLYGQLNYQPLWTNDGRVNRLAAQVIRAIADAPNHALRSELYHSEVLSSLQAEQPIADPAKFEVILSDAFITYKSHLANGIVNPRAQFSSWNKEPMILDFASIYLNAKATGNIANIFTVNDPDYQVLKAAYQEEISKTGGNSNNFVPIPAKKLRPGAKGKAVQILRLRLGLDDNIDVYDDELKQAVKDYQKDKHLTSDGYAGQKTLSLLNRRSPSNHLQTLAINMERHRWGYTPSGTYLQVNIPAYKMAIRNGSKYLFESNVIVGKTKRPTPIFSDTLESIVLAPYWNVPKTIFNEDKLPKLRKNPNAFAGSLEVINKATGKVVNPASVNWSKGGKGYRLRQKPGAKNALGRMKFLFPNRHAIYLHDTPNRKLFKRSKRAFSSGCIRVERAEDLAVFLLKDRNYNRSRVKREGRGKEKWIRLSDNKQYSVFLDYYTAWVDSKGRVRYSSDVYGHDRLLKRLYKQAVNQK